MKTRGWRMADGGWPTRSVLECGGPPPLLPGEAGTHPPQSARGLAHSKTSRTSGDERGTPDVAAAPRRKMVSATPPSPVVMEPACGHERGTSDEDVAEHPRRRGVAATGWRSALIIFCFLLSVFSFRAQGQYAIDWHKIAGGGGTSTGSVYSVSGTIGQPDANVQPMTGGGYALTGGFWALISVVQTAGLPDLTITHTGNSVIVSWPAAGSYTLQQDANLAAGNGGWETSGYTITTTDGTNSITITPPTGNLFFRLQSQ